MIMNYTDLSKVNKQIETVGIKGKQYSPVNERINAFRKLFPDGFIRTSIEKMDEKGILMKAEVGYFEPARAYETAKAEEADKYYPVIDYRTIILGTGHAYEFLAKNRNINSTSMIENCETSAVGRALAMCGIGINASIASYEEVNSAVYAKAEAVKEPEPIPETEAQRKAAGEDFVGFCGKNKLNAAVVAKHYGLSGKPKGAAILAALDDLKSMVDLNTIPKDWRMS